MPMFRLLIVFQKNSTNATVISIRFFSIKSKLTIHLLPINMILIPGNPYILYTFKFQAIIPPPPGAPMAMLVQSTPLFAPFPGTVQEFFIKTASALLI